MLVSPGGTWYKGSKVTVKAKAKTGYAFAGWYDLVTGAKVSTAANYTFTVSKARTLEARFSKRYYVRALADPVDGATVTGSGWFAKGKTATLKAVAKTHFKFLGWYAAKADDPNVADMSVKLSGSATYKPVVEVDLTVFACYQSEPRLEIFKSTGGTVSGVNKYAAGKTATLKATVSKGYAFLGWYDDEGNLLSQATSYKYVMGSENTLLHAEFKKESALATPVLDWNAPTNLLAGVFYSAQPKVSGEAAVKIVSMSCLPTGLSFKSGKVSGAATTAKTNTVSVKVALATNAKKTWILKQKLIVEPLPEWARGTFNGGAAETPMQATITVASSGKVSGKLNFANAVWTLSGTRYSALDLAKETATLSLTAKKGTAKKTVKVTVGVDKLGGFAYSETANFAFEARQNLWKTDPVWVACALELVGRQYVDQGTGLVVMFSENGTAIAKMKSGKNEFSGSAALCPIEFDEGSVVGCLYVYFAPNTANKFKGAVKFVEFVSREAELVMKPRGVQLWKGGPYWAECNVGATKPEEGGYYFWWGDTVGCKRNIANNGWVSVRDGSVFTFTPESCPINTKSTSELRSLGYLNSAGNLAAAHDGARAHLGAPWRLPTAEECLLMNKNCTKMWTTRNGIYGMLVTGKGAYSSKSIFLPAAGSGNECFIESFGSGGDYWTSNLSSSGWMQPIGCVQPLHFEAGVFYQYASYSGFYSPCFDGHCIRAVR